MGTMRDLDQIQERDDAGSTSRVMSLALGGIATACVLFAVGVMVGRETGDGAAPPREDPLARLDRLAAPEAPPATYAERLTGDPATANLPRAATGEGAAGSETAPTTATTAGAPPTPALPAAAAGDRPVLVPGQAAGPGSISLRLHPLNAGAAPSAANGGVPRTLAPAGNEGPYVVQVSSFRAQPHAQQFAQRLRERGYRSYVAAPATAPNGVVWHRVRVGPFTSARDAANFRQEFESRERMPTIVLRREAAGAERD
ncbi:MAG: SPOR domain-containing protein [Polyangiales bacterium]